MKTNISSIDNFIEIANHFVHSKAKLFAYSPSFCELYILLEREDRYFLLKFYQVNYIKTHEEWFFEGLEVDIQEGVRGIHSGCKFFDRNYFEVICSSFHVIEILNGEEVINIGSIP